MTTTTETERPTKSPGLLESLCHFVAGLFGSGSTGVSADAAAENGESQTEVIIAPGGFRIHKPRASDASPIVDVDTVDSVVPEVREGLNLLPPLPTVVLQLIKEIQNTNSTASTVAEIAASDPSLAASILRAVNSSAFGLSSKVTSVSQAVSLLGFGVVRSMVMRFHLEAMMPPRTPQAVVACQDIWTHSLAVSYIAAVLAPRVRDVDQGFASTLGLLHDIGRLAICSQHPDFAAALRATPADKPLLEREAIAFGANHAAVGALLGNRWQLPADLNTAIRWHHDPALAFEATDPLPLRKAVQLVQIADQLAKYCFAYSDEIEIELPGEGAMKMLGFTGSIAQLLDAKVRAAATQAILYAEETGKSSQSLVRPFVHLRRGQEAADLCQRMRSSAGPAIPTGSAAGELIESCDDASTFDAGHPGASDSDGRPQGRFNAPGTQAGIDWLIKSITANWHAAGIASRTADCARAALRALLPNVLAEQNSSVDVAWQWEAPALHLAIHSPAIAFAARFPAADFDKTGQALAAELANLRNLGWFNIESSPDGAALLLRSR